MVCNSKNWCFVINTPRSSVVSHRWKDSGNPRSHSLETNGLSVILVCYQSVVHCSNVLFVDHSGVNAVLGSIFGQICNKQIKLNQFIKNVSYVFSRFPLNLVRLRVSVEIKCYIR